MTNQTSKSFPQNVIVVEEILTKYRHEFHAIVKAKLTEKNVNYQVWHGNQSLEHRKKQFIVEKNYFDKYRNIRFMGFVLQLVSLSQLRKSNLVIVNQGNRLLLNYYLLICKKVPVALWGHGRNYQSTKYNLRERWKRNWSKRADFWLAYTEEVNEYLTQIGFPPNKIRVLNNSIPNTRNSNIVISKKRNQCVFVGALYTEKRIEDLIRIADFIFSKISDFKLIIVGEGPLSNLIKKATRTREYLVHIGAEYGKDKDEHLMKSELILMPGLVGLVSIESFNFETPIVTFRNSKHSPEFAYLKNNYNSLIVEEDSNQVFAKQVIDLLEDRNRLEDLRMGCLESSPKYSFDKFVDNYVKAIFEFLGRK